MSEVSYVPVRMKDEPIKAYEWFVRYVSLGDRSLPQLQSVYNEIEGFPSLSTIYRWGKQWRWKERAEEYDNSVAVQTAAIATEDLQSLRSVVNDLLLDKTKVLKDELADYEKMLREWRARDLSDMTVKDFRAMISARVELSNVAYRLAGLNNVMGGKVGDETPQQNVTINVYSGEQSPQVLEGTYYATNYADE